MTESSLRLPSGLSPLQSAAIAKILENSSERFVQIREHERRVAQFANVEVSHSEFTGVGGYVHFSVPPDAPYRGELRDGCPGVHGIHSKLGTYATFVLWISDGCIDFLEYVATAAEWPEDESLFELFSDDDLRATGNNEANKSQHPTA